MTDKEIFFKMLEMQKEYDQKVFDAYCIDDGYKAIEDYIFNALLDEIGELNHELKGHWCWWKNTQKPVDREKVLEEFADVVHFCFCWINAKWRPTYIDRQFSFYGNSNSGFNGSMTDVINGLAIGNPMYVLCASKAMLNLSWIQVYECYCKKHEINLKRVRNGY